MNPRRCRPRPGRERAASCLLARALLVLLLHVPAVHADAAKPWAVLYSAGPLQPEPEITSQLVAIRAALQRHEIAVVDEMARVLSATSEPGIAASSEQLAQMQRHLNRASQQLAMGELKGALGELEQFEQQPLALQDALNRQPSEAKKAFSTCVTAAFLLHQSGRAAEASPRVQRCARRFPAFDLSPSQFSEGMRRWFEAEVAGPEHMVWLRVEARSIDRPCTVRINGVDVGRAPMRIRAHLGAVRAQLECDEQPMSNVHTRELSRGENLLRIDPALDQALRHSDAFIYLRYSDREGFAQTAAHAVEIGTALGVSEVLQVVAGAPLRFRHIEVGSGRVVAQSEWSGIAAELNPAVDALLQRPTDISRLTRPSPPPPRRRTATGWFDLEPAAPELYWVVGGLWAASIATSAIMLDARASLRAEGGRLWLDAGPDPTAETEQRLQSLNDDYNTKSWTAMLVAGSTSALMVTSAVLTLPEQTPIPWWAYGVGGLGAAMVVTGAVVWTTVESCPVTNPAERCGDWTHDGSLGPLLIVHGAGPLSVGLTYLLSAVTRSDVEVALHAGDGVTSLSVRGRL
jgi:hypothetical protein